jgi:hypothetical protein
LAASATTDTTNASNITSGTLGTSRLSGSYTGVTGVGTLTDVAATGNLTVGGNTILGNASTDTLNVGNGGLVKDASGNVGIGTTSPSSKLHVDSLTTAQIARFNSTATNGGYITGYSSGTAIWDLGSAKTAFDTGSSTDVGLTSRGSGYLGFGTNSTERARIDASGNLLVGTTSGSLDGFGEKLFVSQNSANAAFIASNTNSSCISPAIIGVTADRNTTNNTFYPISYYNRGAALYKFRVADSGNVTNTNNSYGQISDIKLKENIVDATQKLEKLNQVRVVNFNFIGDQQKQIGVIAQELEQVFPSMVEESIDRDEEGNDLGTTTKSVKYSVFVPMLIKAIQEQQAIIQTLTNRITALEGAN